MGLFTRIFFPVKYKERKHIITHSITDINDNKAVYMSDENIIGDIEYGLATKDLLWIGKLRIYEEHSSYRGQGIGTDLLYYVLNRHSNIKEVRLSCSSYGGKNALTTAQLDEFYQKFTYGFLSQKHIAYTQDSACDRKRKHLSPNL